MLEEERKRLCKKIRDEILRELMKAEKDVKTTDLTAKLSEKFSTPKQRICGVISSMCCVEKIIYVSFRGMPHSRIALV